jgi:hypothetical protein
MTYIRLHIPKAQMHLEHQNILDYLREGKQYSYTHHKIYNMFRIQLADHLNLFEKNIHSHSCEMMDV